MKNNKEIEKQFNELGFNNIGNKEVSNKMLSFILQSLTERTKEIEKKIWDILEIEVGDMPAFPPKDTDLISLSLIIGKEKIKRKRTEDIKKEIMARKIDVIYT